MKMALYVLFFTIATTINVEEHKIKEPDKTNLEDQEFFIDFHTKKIKGGASAIIAKIKRAI